MFNKIMTNMIKKTYMNRKINNLNHINKIKKLLK